MDARDIGCDLEKVLVTEEEIDARLTELAAEIDAYYAGEPIVLVGVLRGSVMVMADLARKLHTPLVMDWMATSSYGSSTKTSGVVRILKDLNEDISGRRILIVEDIIDSGLTLSWLVKNLKSREPKEIKIMTMLRKPEAIRKMEVDVQWVAFEIGEDFVIGYGLDYQELYRDLPFIGTLAPHVYEGEAADGDSRVEESLDLKEE